MQKYQSFRYGAQRSEKSQPKKTETFNQNTAAQNEISRRNCLATAGKYSVEMTHPAIAIRSRAE